MLDLTLSQVRLSLNPLRGFNQSYLVHQLVADLFGQRDDRGYLFRLVAEAPREATVLVLSQEVPTDSPPLRRWGHTLDLRSRPYDPKLSSEQVLDYEVRLNATCVVTQSTGKKKRLDVWDAALLRDRNTPRTPHEVYREYVARKLGSTAEILECRVVGRGEMKAARSERKRSIRFVATNLIGTLRLTDPEGFLDTVATGIGRSRAFGCGLICLSRPGSILPRRYRMANPS